MSVKRNLLLTGAAVAALLVAGSPVLAAGACDAMMADDTMMADDSMKSDDTMMADDSMADDSMKSDDAMMADDSMADDSMKSDDAMMADDSMAADSMSGDAMMGAEYVVQPGDSLWSIANSQLCDGELYPDLAKANNLSADAVLVPGQVLHIPD